MKNVIKILKRMQNATIINEHKDRRKVLNLLSITKMQSVVERYKKKKDQGSSFTSPSLVYSVSLDRTMEELK